MKKFLLKFRYPFLSILSSSTFTVVFVFLNVSSSWAIIHHFDDEESQRWGRNKKFRSVGHLRFQLKNGDVFNSTGVLITPSVVLTCGHCVTFKAKEEIKTAFFNVNSGGVGSISKHQVLDAPVFLTRIHEELVQVGKDDYRGIDLALVRLMDPMTITPAVVFDGDPLSLVKKKGYVVGYGISGVGTGTVRVADERKRMAMVPISEVYQNISFIYGLIHGDPFRFYANSEVPYLGLPARGDSGGPLFVGGGGGIQVAGIYHGIVGGTHHGLGVGRAVWENVYAHLDWIKRGVSELTGDQEFIRLGHSEVPQ